MLSSPKNKKNIMTNFMTMTGKELINSYKIDEIMEVSNEKRKK